MNVILKRSDSREAFNEVFFDEVRDTVFNGSLSQGQVNNLNALLDAFELYGDGKSKSLAYILATVRLEVGSRMEPVRENFAITDQKARLSVRYRKYGKPEGPYGHVYYGRGYVQLTWWENYIASSKDAGADLEKYPDKMLVPKIAAKITVLGILDGRFNGDGHGIAHYLPDNGTDDLKNARRTVNITDRWDEVARHYENFLSAVRNGRRAFAAPRTIEPTETPVRANVGTKFSEWKRKYPNLTDRDIELELFRKELNAPASEPGFLMPRKEETMFGNTLNFKSKTFWTGAAMVIAGVVQFVAPETVLGALASQFFGSVEAGLLVTNGLAIIFGREAIEKNRT